MSLLPRKKPKGMINGKLPRWKSPAHLASVRERACCVCGSFTNIEAAHYRLGSHTGLSMKPDDWRVVGLCAGPHANSHGQLGCHNRQHIVGEETFWRDAGKDPLALIDLYCAVSPKASEIARIRKERVGG